MSLPENGSSANQYIKFVVRFLLIALVIFICDRGVGTILKHYYFSQDSGECYGTTFSIDSTVAEVIILGSSRAKCSYVPELFEDSLNYTCYNTGRDGNFLLFNYAIFKELTRRYNPKVIVFDISPEEMEYRSWEYDRLSQLLPYYKTHPEIRKIVDLRDPFVRIKQISAIYPYNSLLFKIVLGNMEFNKKRITEYNGYVPYFKTMENSQIDTSELTDFTIDNNKIKALKDIISTCKEEDIELVFVYSPVWKIIPDNSLNHLVSDLCTENGILFLNLSNHSDFISNPGYFADILHLNEEGARVFSTMLISKLGSDK